MAARSFAGRATTIRDDEERGSETGRREKMIGRDDGSGGERTGFATSNNECLLPPAKPSFSLLQPAEISPRARLAFLSTYLPTLRLRSRADSRSSFSSKTRGSAMGPADLNKDNKTGLIPVYSDLDATSFRENTRL